jgi:hypothetical protein
MIQILNFERPEPKSMSITVQWDSADKRVILVAVADTWQWSEAHDALNQMVAMLDSTIQPVDTILQLGKDILLPPTDFVANVKHIAQTLYSHPRFGRLVFVMGKSPLQALIASATQTYGAPDCGRFFAATTDDARALLA